MAWYIQLRNYAEWYYTKYFPSRRALHDKLLSKWDDEAIVDRVLADLSSLIMEEKVIESRIHGYIAAGKTARYIRTKMLQKKFDMSLVDSVLLSRDDDIKNPENYRSQIEKMVHRSFQKWISKKMISYEISLKYPDARSVVDELLSSYDDREILQKKAPELLRKYSQEQCIQKLLQKGFRMNDIYTVFRRR